MCKVIFLSREPAVLAYHIRELAVPANPWMKVIYSM
jgi:hypothetical protein